MSFFSSRSRPIARPARRSAPAIAIGQHVFVDSAGNHSGSVALADVSGKVVSAVHLADGLEVEVVAWRPRGPSETRYRVRAPDDVDGWLPAENLRRDLVAVPLVDPSGAVRPVGIADDSGGRPFGQRSHVARAPVSLPLVPGLAQPVADSGGRRFGQH